MRSGSTAGNNTLVGSDNDNYNFPSDDHSFIKISKDGGLTYETLTRGEYGDNCLVANGVNSSLYGAGGDDFLNANVSSFSDTDIYGSDMYGGEGNDTLAGGYLKDL